MSDFDNLADGGRQLARLLGPAAAEWPDPVLVPVLPNGVPVVVGIRDALPLPVCPLPVARSHDGVIVEPVPALAGRTAVIVDDGVETGTVARAAVGPVRASGAAAVVLAVPVCPREVLADLQLRYDHVIAVATPLVRRSLAWHFRDFDTVDEPTALSLLADMRGESPA